MRQSIDLTGKKFGSLIVTQISSRDKRGQILWLCLCDCGIKTTIRGSDLVSSNTKSCGCLKKKLLIQRSTTHGHANRKHESKTYISWRSISQRCNNPNNYEYNNYGGRGIEICSRWQKFVNFLEDMGERPDGHSLDRIDNDGSYCKENCRWATPKEQSRNTRQNHLLSFDGKTQCVLDWAKSIGINPKTLYTRLNRGWTTELAITTPPKSTKILIECNVCNKMFLKSPKRITQTIKLQQNHTCSRKCSSSIANEPRRCEPSTVNASNTRKDKDKFPAKDHARSLVRHAVKTGKLIPLEECEFCDREGKIEGHHPDHSKPYLLLYLCKDCHRRADSSDDKWESLATDYSGCIT